MSAITGICDLRAISGSASASSCDGTATRTIWHPDAVSSAICCSVAFTSAVSVVVIDWTDTGAPPPTGTACFPLPTMICLDTRRGVSWAGGIWGRPRLTVIGLLASRSSWWSLAWWSLAWWSLARLSLAQGQRVEDIGGDQQQAQADQQREDPDAHRDDLGDIDQAGIRAAPPACHGGPEPLVADDSDVPAVQWQQGQQVEDPDEDVHGDDDVEYERGGLTPVVSAGHDLPGDVGRADHAAELAAR